jgi:hypothetical protein
MKSTNAEPMILPVLEPLWAESCGGVMKFRARWQAAVDTASGYATQKLRLESALSVSELLLTSIHRSNDNDLSINIVRPSHLPFSA